jgi:hypothetical protein
MRTSSPESEKKSATRTTATAWAKTRLVSESERSDPDKSGQRRACLLIVLRQPRNEPFHISADAHKPEHLRAA